MRRNHDKYKAMVMGKMSPDPVFKCEGTSIPLVEEVQLLGVMVDDKLKFERQSEAANHCSEKLLPLKLREKLHREFIAPHFNCAESWHIYSNGLK